CAKGSRSRSRSSDHVTDAAGAPSGERLVVGLVRGVHGLRGALRVEVLTDNADRFAPGSLLYPEGTDRALTIRDAHRDGPGMLVRFAEVRNRDAADALRDIYLEAATGELPPSTFYWHQVVGSTVFTTA